ncbi:predicted protein [Histoplasma mississippiense (nom. inval.)]|uniref:predicted protein n=1 Tax=Ajellomyces capsulatus (strain NAm1 / WU24) TaxID=2059318 RepID=UPI000157CC24|nr:predicted protein [Histoplasma mississippiense (nom. inval.)]EDN10293.1 predicted protein [Histoplasma mississippiense (nom. inval.)]
MAVGPRVSKEDFMHALGLDANNPQHEPFYRAMRDEAIVVYNILNQDNSNLLENLRNDPSIRPPFFWHHIRPERQRWGILEIWRNSKPVTRAWFDRGITDGEYGPNWVTGWLLYSVFRSRDVRDSRRMAEVLPLAVKDKMGDIMTPSGTARTDAWHWARSTVDEAHIFRAFGQELVM